MDPPQHLPYLGVGAIDHWVPVFYRRFCSFGLVHGWRRRAAAIGWFLDMARKLRLSRGQRQDPDWTAPKSIVWMISSPILPSRKSDFSVKANLKALSTSCGRKMPGLPKGCVQAVAILR